MPAACKGPGNIRCKEKKKKEKPQTISCATFQVRQNYQSHLDGTNRDLPYQNKCSESSCLVFP